MTRFRGLRARPAPPTRGTPEERLRDLAAGTDGPGPDEPAPAGPGPDELAVARVRRRLAAEAVPPMPTHRRAELHRVLAAEPRPAPRHRPVAVVAAAAVAALGILGGVLVATDTLGPSAPPPPAWSAAPPEADPGTVEPVRLARGDLPAALRTVAGHHDPADLADPARRADCLAAHGVPPRTPVVAARPVVLDGTPGVLLVLPGGVRGRFRILVVGQGCSSASPQGLADVVVGR